MSDRSQWEAKLDGRERSFSEATERQAEMIKWEEKGAS